MIALDKLFAMIVGIAMIDETMPLESPYAEVATTFVSPAFVKSGTIKMLSTAQTSGMMLASTDAKKLVKKICLTACPKPILLAVE